MSKTILIAAVLLSGGVTGKDGKIASCTVQPGDELTADKLKALGLAENDVEAFIAEGKIAQTEVREAVADDDTDAAALAAANKRADDAEAALKVAQAKIAELEAAAKKPGAAQ